jgi:tRNA-dihydrouridine synthase 1
MRDCNFNAYANFTFKTFINVFPCTLSSYRRARFSAPPPFLPPKITKIKYMRPLPTRPPSLSLSSFRQYCTTSRKRRNMTIASADGKFNPPESVPQADAAWQWFHSLGAPKYWVAPMVDQSELPFRLLCLRHGATAAYTPMLHARLFLEKPTYRKEHFATCAEDRPVLAQFCANDPEILLGAARIVEPHVDGVDLNLGCPQRIASRGRYGAYLMDDLPLVERLVSTLASNLNVPVTVKIRRFDDIERTVAYAAMLERAGASLVAVHGRTRQQRQASACLAEWEYISAVKRALRVPVLANGNIRTLHDVESCMKVTGTDGVLSAESLLEDPALFSPQRLLPGGELTQTDGPKMLLEYLELCKTYPVPWRMLKGHTFKLIGPWLSEFVDLRDVLNRGKTVMDRDTLEAFTHEVITRIKATGRTYAVPALSARKLAELEKEAAKQAAIAEQQAEEEALRELDTQAIAPESEKVSCCA